MQQFEKQISNVFKSVKLKNKSDMLTKINANSNFYNLVNTLHLSFLSKLKILFNIRFNFFYKSLNYSRMQLASFVFLFVILANISLPIFIQTSQADFVPHMESTSDFKISRLKDSFYSKNSQIYPLDQVYTNSFSNITISDTNRIRVAEASNFIINDYNISQDRFELDFNLVKGEYWFNISSNLDQVIDVKIGTTTCNLNVDNSATIYVKSNLNSLNIQNFGSDLDLDCTAFNGNMYKVRSGKSFVLDLVNTSSFGLNSFISKNIQLDKDLKFDMINSVLENNNLNAIEINKMMISIKLNNLVELNEYQYLNNRLDLLKLSLRKSLVYGVQGDLDNFKNQIDSLKRDILSFRTLVLESDLQSLEKTNLFSSFLNWLNKEIDNSSNLLALEYQIYMKNNLIEVLFLYFNDYVNPVILSNYLDLLSSNTVLLLNKNDEFRFNLLKSLYVFKNLKFNSPEESDLILNMINSLIETLTDSNYSSQNLSFETFTDTSKSILISDIDDSLYLDLLVY